MADTPTEWSQKQRQKISEQLVLFGRIGFYIQLALLVVPVLLTVYIFLLGGADQSSGFGINIRNYISFGSLLVMIFTTYWFYRYIRLGERIKDPARPPSQSTVATTLWVGMWAGCLGIVFSMLLLLAAAWRMLFVLLLNPQSGMLIAPTLGTNPTYSISAIDAVSLTLLVITLGAELVVLGLTLWLLFRATGSSPAETETAPATHVP